LGRRNPPASSNPHATKERQTDEQDDGNTDGEFASRRWEVTKMAGASRRIPRRFTIRDFEEPVEEQPQARVLPVSEYAARFLESVANLRGITPQQALDEIIAYHHMKGEIDTDMKELFDSLSEVDFSKLTPEAIRVMNLILSLTERFSRLQTLAALRVLNLYSLIQPIQVVQQQVTAPPAPPAPSTPSQAVEIPVETAQPSIIPENFRQRIENAIMSGFERYLEKVCQRLEQPETTDVKKVFQEEMMPMVKQMVNSITSILMNMTQPKQQQVETRPPSEEEKKILEALK